MPLFEGKGVRVVDGLEAPLISVVVADDGWWRDTVQDPTSRGSAEEPRSEEVVGVFGEDDDAAVGELADLVGRTRVEAGDVVLAGVGIGAAAEEGRISENAIPPSRLAAM